MLFRNFFRPCFCPCFRVLSLQTRNVSLGQSCIQALYICTVCNSQISQLCVNLLNFLSARLHGNFSLHCELECDYPQFPEFSYRNVIVLYRSAFKQRSSLVGKAVQRLSGHVLAHIRDCGTLVRRQQLNTLKFLSGDNLICLCVEILISLSLSRFTGLFACQKVIVFLIKFSDNFPFFLDTCQVSTIIVVNIIRINDND